MHQSDDMMQHVTPKQEAYSFPAAHMYDVDTTHRKGKCTSGVGATSANLIYRENSVSEAIQVNVAIKCNSHIHNRTACVP